MSNKLTYKHKKSLYPIKDRGIFLFIDEYHLSTRLFS
nr:MAG TPA: Flavivirus DEAD domain [Caudoviricetes sp.]